ncbi:hypothetical protein BJ973_001416 [Actinoplanes tereljensis]|uniref:DUF6879 domain-containing protein n=1 Tax=Paractinoplanes tereljensis TaxID=571912 RepID=A0A919NLG1_9ACTN|nr:DUF6879 family protein [Actinoplanes tereljensis]GIF20678.1 hypothetical protein Ate02nite_34080 [Actinoplanes tereljensis]
MRVGLKLLIAAAVGGLSYLFTGLGDQRSIWRLAVAVAVGAFTLVAQLLIEAAEASRHLELARQATMSRRDVTRLVAAGGVPDAPGRQLLDGVRAERGDSDWLLGLTETAATGIDAVTIASYGEGEFWSSDLGRQYLERQRDAIARGVRIRRLFLLTDRTPDPRRLDALLEPHRAIGVQTRVVPGFRQTVLDDFTVFDQKVSYEFRTARVTDDGIIPMVASVALVADPRLVKRRQERFEQLWSGAVHP